MKIIVDHTSMQPIYEQIVEQIKKQILQGTLREGAPLDSVRMLAKDLKVSALTVKKAYDALEEEQLIATVHGKGSFVTACGRTEKRDRAADGTAGGEGAGVWHERRRTAGGSGIVFGSIGVQSQEWRII